MTPANAKALMMMLEIQDAIDEINKDTKELLDKGKSLEGGYDRLLDKINKKIPGGL